MVHPGLPNTMLAMMPALLALSYKLMNMTTDNYRHQYLNLADRSKEKKEKQLIFGFLILLAGVMLLGKKTGLFFIGFHLWPLFLIALGVAMGFKSGFRSLGSWALIILGILFLIPRFTLFGVLTTHLVGPVLLILFGAYLMLKPARKAPASAAPNAAAPTHDVHDASFIADASFSERNVVVTSKSFSGGQVVSNFSEVKIDMMDAEMEERAVLTINASFSEIEIQVPGHWNIELNSNNVLSSVEDRRWLIADSSHSGKTLYIEGNYSFSKIILKSR